jgi:hypothetical protein
VRAGATRQGRRAGSRRRSPARPNVTDLGSPAATSVTTSPSRGPLIKVRTRGGVISYCSALPGTIVISFPTEMSRAVPRAIRPAKIASTSGWTRCCSTALSSGRAPIEGSKAPARISSFTEASTSTVTPCASAKPRVLSASTRVENQAKLSASQRSEVHHLGDPVHEFRPQEFSRLPSKAPLPGCRPAHLPPSSSSCRIRSDVVLGRCPNWMSRRIRRWNSR